MLNTRETRWKTHDSLEIYMQEIGEIPSLTRAEETTLIPAAQGGDKAALDKVVRANLRFVVTIANEYDGRSLPISDLISEGNLGLLRALETFDVTRGVKFITYAKWWIRQTIIYALIYKGHVVRLPQSQVRKLNRVRKMVDALEKGLNRRATDSEIDAAVGTDQNIFRALSTYPVHHNSLDAPLSHDDKSSLISIVPDTQVAAPDRSLNERSFKVDLRLAFSILEEREKLILSCLFGLQGQRAQTLGEVGDRLGISRERVRQIKNAALDKLRDSEEVMNALIEYLD